MQAGETIMHKPFVLRYCKDGLEGVTKAVPCKVLWVHPEGRFAVLERANGRTNEREERGNENDSGNELEEWGGKNRNRPHFGRRAAPRREDFSDR